MLGSVDTRQAQCRPGTRHESLNREVLYCASVLLNFSLLCIPMSAIGTVIRVDVRDLRNLHTSPFYIFCFDACSDLIACCMIW